MTDAARPDDVRAAVRPSRWSGIPRLIAWGAGTVAVAFIALVASIGMVDHILKLAAHFPSPYGRLGIAFITAYLLGGVGALVVAWRLGGRLHSRPWLLPVAIVALTIGVRAVVALAFDAPLTGENRIIHQQALNVLDGASCCFSHRPMGYPLALAGSYAIFGAGAHAIEILNLACAAVTTWLVFDIGRVGWDRRVGALAAAGFAIMPSQVLMTLPPLTEPLYTAAVAAVVRLAIGAPSRPLIAAAAVGLAVAAGQWVRATAASMLAPILLLSVLSGTAIRRWLPGAAMTLVAFVVAMMPVISFNLQTHGDLSVSTSAYAGWSLFVGGNQASAGRWNPDDAALFTDFPGISAWEKSEHAGGLGLRRIFEDPDGYLEMQPRKFTILWGDESYAAGYSLTIDGTVVTREVRVGWLLSQLFYAPLLVLALIGLIAERRNPRPAVLLIAMIVFSVAATHLFLEVHSRYHAYVIPLLGVLAAVGIDAIVRRRSRRESSLA
jgi:hypothetical protein